MFQEAVIVIVEVSFVLGLFLPALGGGCFGRSFVIVECICCCRCFFYTSGRCFRRTCDIEISVDVDVSRCTSGGCFSSSCCD